MERAVAMQYDKCRHKHAQHNLGSAVAQEEDAAGASRTGRRRSISGKVSSVKTTPAVARTVPAQAQQDALRISSTVPAKTKRLSWRSSLGMRPSSQYMNHASSTAATAMIADVNQKLTFRRSHRYAGCDSSFRCEFSSGVPESATYAGTTTGCTCAAARRAKYSVSSAVSKVLTTTATAITGEVSICTSVDVKSAANSGAFK